MPDETAWRLVKSRYRPCRGGGAKSNLFRLQLFGTQRPHPSRRLLLTPHKYIRDKSSRGGRLSELWPSAASFAASEKLSVRVAGTKPSSARRFQLDTVQVKFLSASNGLGRTRCQNFAASTMCVSRPVAAVVTTATSSDQHCPAGGRGQAGRRSGAEEPAGRFQVHSGTLPKKDCRTRKALSLLQERWIMRRTLRACDTSGCGHDWHRTAVK